MPIETLESTATARKLVAAWIEAKEQERKANTTRLGIEEELFKAYQGQIPEKGSVKIDSLKITCGYNDKWDQDELQEIRANWPDGCSVPFPFREELKPDGKAISYIRDNVPDIYEVLAQALTQDPKKPAFSTD